MPRAGRRLHRFDNAAARSRRTFAIHGGLPVQPMDSCPVIVVLACWFAELAFQLAKVPHTGATESESPKFQGNAQADVTGRYLAASPSQTPATPAAPRLRRPN